MVIISSITLAGCNVGDSGGKGAVGIPGPQNSSIATRTYDVGGFTGVTVTGPDNVTIRRGERFSVGAAGNSATLDKLVIRVVEGKLEIGRVRTMLSLGTSIPAAVRVTLPTLDNLTVVGSGSAQSDTLTGDRSEVSIVGSGDIGITNIETGRINMTVAGSGNLTAAGQATRVDANTVGSGSIAASRLTTPRANISGAGAGDIALNVTEAAEVSTVGSGDVTVTGGGRCTTSSLGSGTIRCR